MRLLALGMVVSLLVPFSPARSQGLIVNEGLGKSLISGTITEITPDIMTIAIEDDTRVRVNIDDIELDQGIEGYFSEGMRVEVVGEFEDGEMDAHQIRKLPN